MLAELRPDLFYTDFKSDYSYEEVQERWKTFIATVWQEGMSNASLIKYIASGCTVDIAAITKDMRGFAFYEDCGKISVLYLLGENPSSYHCLCLLSEFISTVATEANKTTISWT